MGRPKLDYDYRRKYDLTRSPAWRYDRVQRRMADGKPLHPQRDDQYTHILRRFYQAKRKLQAQIENPEDLKDELCARFTYVWNADNIFQLGSDHRVRYELEANILSRRSVKEIATKCQVEPQTVQFYEAMFFNVVDKLDARSYIAGTVLGPAFMAGLSSKSLELTAKYFGYFAGPHVLDHILDAFTNEINPPHEPSEISQWLDRQFRSRIRTSAMIGITFMDPKDYNIRTLLEGFQSLLSLSNREQSQTGDDNVLNRAIQTFVNLSPVPLGDDADRLPARPGLIYGDGAVEPRIREIEQVSRGQTPQLLELYTQPGWDNPALRNISNAKTDNRQDS